MPQPTARAQVSTGSAAGRSRARPRQISASTGRSSPPVLSGYAMIGEAVTTTVHSHGRRTPLSRSAVPNATTNTTPNHTRGSVSRPPPNEGVRHPEERQRGQVWVVHVRVVRGGEGARALIRGALVQEQLGRPDDHADLGLAHPGRGHPGQRDQHGPGHADRHGQRQPAAPPGQRHQRGQAVGRGGQFAPEPLRRVRADRGDRAGEQRTGDQQGGWPLMLDRARTARRPGAGPARQPSREPVSPARPARPRVLPAAAWRASQR